MPCALWTVYNGVFKQYYCHERQNIQLCMHHRPIFCLFTQNFSVCQIDHSIVILFTLLTEWTISVSVCLSNFKPASWFKKSIKKVMKGRSKKMCGHGVSVNQKSDVCESHIVCDFLFYGYPCSKNENISLQ